MPITSLFTKEDSKTNTTPEVTKTPEVPVVDKAKDADRHRRLIALGYR
jgi:hypothetical protein